VLIYFYVLGARSVEEEGAEREREKGLRERERSVFLTKRTVATVLQLECLINEK